MRKIILDTNFLLIPGRFKVDIFSEIQRICDFEYELCVVDKSLNELDRIIDEQKTEFKMAAKIGKELVDKMGVKVIKTDSDAHVDDIIVDMADKDTIVATQDKELKSRLKEKGVGVIDLKQKSHLIIQQNL